MTLAFILSMPGRNSWNGKWTGDESCYAILRTFGDKWGTKILQKSYHSYNFGDGWCAGVQIKRVNATESRNLRKRSKGFCGYEWMIQSIINDGAIYGPSQPKLEQKGEEK